MQHNVHWNWSESNEQQFPTAATHSQPHAHERKMKRAKKKPVIILSIWGNICGAAYCECMATGHGPYEKFHRYNIITICGQRFKQPQRVQRVRHAYRNGADRHTASEDAATYFQCTLGMKIFVQADFVCFVCVLWAAAMCIALFGLHILCNCNHDPLDLVWLHSQTVQASLKLRVGRMFVVAIYRRSMDMQQQAAAAAPNMF